MPRRRGAPRRCCPGDLESPERAGLGVGKILMLILLPLLFSVLALSAAVLIVRFLSLPGIRRDVERYRLFFLFGACLTMACWASLWLARLMSLPVQVTQGAALGLNILGGVLTLVRGRWIRRTQNLDSQVGGEGPGVRVYTVYYDGKPLGLVTRGAFDKLAELGLLKKQRTVELVDDYPRRARGQGATVQLLKSKDGTQTLIGVVMDPQREST